MIERDTENEIRAGNGTTRELVGVRVWEPGTPVEFHSLQGRLGLMSGPAATRTREETVGSGDRGTYRSPHLDPELAADGWHLVDVEVAGVQLVCGVHESQFRQVFS